jgi:hypothetical protein
MKNYINKQGYSYLPESEDFGYTSIKVLPFLVGRLWDNVALAYVHALRPSYIRVIEGAETLDAMTWRVTVRLNDDNKIREIEQEVEVWLPDGVEHGHALDHALAFGVDSEQCKWHQDAEHTILFEGHYYKSTKDGLVEFPNNGNPVTPASAGSAQICPRCNGNRNDPDYRGINDCRLCGGTGKLRVA